MAKLFLKFEQTLLKEFPLTRGVVSIGRLPDNNVQIDNPAVSAHHATIFYEPDHYVVEDHNSTNGTYLNNRRVSKAVLHDADQVLIGKHVLVFQDETWKRPGAKSAVPSMPSLDETVVLDTRHAKELLTHTSGGQASEAAKGKERVGMLTVLQGKTEQRSYVLSAKLSIIGKSDMASIKLRGWFAPKVAAVINHRDGRYFIAASERDIKLRVNEVPISGQKELQEGDLVEVAKVKMTFSFMD